MGDAGDTTPSDWTHINGSLTPNENHTAGGVSIEPIAIVGASCRLPGGASSPSKLWELLEAGKSAWGPFPESRFSHQGFHTEGTVKAGTVCFS